MGLLQMPSVKNVKKQFCCTRGPYRDPLVHCSLSVSRNYSLTIREQLLWQSLSYTQWMRPCQATTSSTSPNLQTPWRYTTYPTGSHVNLHADGTAKDGDKGSFSYTRVTLLSLSSLLPPLHFFAVPGFHPLQAACSPLPDQYSLPPLWS